MNSRLLELATRHGALKVRIDDQRRRLGQQSAPLESALSRGDTVLEGVDWLKHHPVAVAAAVAAVVVARPRRAWRWAKRGFFVWRGWQAIRSSLQGVR
ncbi:MAG: YqjK family protein [Azonexus sp.]|nr:YqjK family protein [Azonexus sp.]